MKEYILTSINNRLLKNKRSETLYGYLKGFDRFFFTEADLEEFMVWIDTTLSNLNKEYTRMSPLTISVHTYGTEMVFWIKIRPAGANTENQLLLAFTKIMGKWAMPNLPNDNGED